MLTPFFSNNAVIQNLIYGIYKYRFLKNMGLEDMGATYSDLKILEININLSTITIFKNGPSIIIINKYLFLGLLSLE